MNVGEYENLEFVFMPAMHASTGAGGERPKIKRRKKNDFGESLLQSFALVRLAAALVVRPPFSPSPSFSPLTPSHAYCESAISCLTLSPSSSSQAGAANDADISPNLLLTL